MVEARSIFHLILAADFVAFYFTKAPKRVMLLDKEASASGIWGPMGTP